ncbi:MAG: Hsp20/alpha crystallin family protein [Bacteroidetes bacterium]|nr:Hsp20/alpha crystallin family protein [Candidatus Colenecus caballi]
MLLARRNQYNPSVMPGILSDLFNDDWFFGHGATSVPAMNVVENEKNYELEFAVPGLKKEDLNLQIDQEGIMSVSMVKKEDKENKTGRNFIRREFSYNQFSQSYILPDDAEREAVSAKVSDGILTISVPKLEPEQAKPAVRTIDIA